MRKSLLTLAACALVCICSADATATANFVYHEQTANFVATPTCPSAGTDTACGRYVENTDRSGSAGFQIYSPETYTLHFKVEFQFFTNQVRVYYTTDGSDPSGSFGTPFGTTQVATASYTCTYSDQTQGCQIVDVVTGVIPAQPAGTTVKYIVGAWHSGGGPEVFANSGTCSGCFSCTDSTAGCAAVFQYNVIAVPATPLVISEFRLRGPGGASDEFIEIYNSSDSNVTVQAFDGSAGFAVAAADFLTRFTIPNGTVIPARGHYLGVNSAGYTLTSYPASTTTSTSAGGGGDEPDAPVQTSEPTPAGSRGRKKTTPRVAAVARVARLPLNEAASAPDTIPGPSATATGDATYTTEISDNVGFALFNTANPANFNLTTRLDAAGSTSEANTLFKEGAGYPALGGASYLAGIEYSFFRDLCGKGGSITTLGPCTRTTPQDTGDNAADFIFVDTNGTPAGAGQRLGAPGPENSTSPVERNGQLPGGRIFPCVSSAAPPNRVRDFTSDPANNSTFGTLSIRIRVTNNTGANVTRLRFRLIDQTTFPAPADYADLRARTSSLAVVLDPCNGNLPATVFGTTLEEPPAQPNGGGFNSTLSAGTITLVTPLAPGANYDFQLLFGIQQTGRFKAYVNVEALP
ncbi:MAG: lamin tail domain-containing protein [Pyrinomonadaceae bacterium]